MIKKIDYIIYILLIILLVTFFDYNLIPSLTILSLIIYVISKYLIRIIRRKKKLTIGLIENVWWKGISFFRLSLGLFFVFIGLKNYWITNTGLVEYNTLFMSFLGLIVIISTFDNLKFNKVYFSKEKVEFIDNVFGNFREWRFDNINAVTIFKNKIEILRNNETQVYDLADSDKISLNDNLELLKSYINEKLVIE